MITYFLIGFILGIIVSIFVWKYKIKDMDHLHNFKDVQDELSDFLPCVIFCMIIFILIWPIAILFIIIYIVMLIIGCKDKKIDMNKDK